MAQNPKYIVKPTGTRDEHQICLVHSIQGTPTWHEVIGYGETFAHAHFIAFCLAELTEEQITRANRRTVAAADDRRNAA